jgi:hypothetical protein
MLEHPSNPALRVASQAGGTVTMCRVRTISRKDLRVEEVSPETVRQPPLAWEAKIQSELHGDVERSTEMIDPLEREAPV